MTEVVSGDVITITCPEGEAYVGGNPRKTCGNDGSFHPRGGHCDTGMSILMELS